MTPIGLLSIIYYNHLARRGHSFVRSFPSRYPLFPFPFPLCGFFFVGNYESIISRGKLIAKGWHGKSRLGVVS